MKKLFLFLSILSLISLSPLTSSAIKGDGTEGTPFIITTQEELYLISDFPDCNFELGNDISLEGEWTPLCTYSDDFTGKFNGNGYTISNLQVSNFINSGLFSINNGIIKNLNIQTSEIGITSNNILENNIGIITGINNGSILGCNVNGVINYTNTLHGEKNKDFHYNAYLGGICGKNTGKIEKINANILSKDIIAYFYEYHSAPSYIATANSYSYKGQGIIYFGGVTGINSGTITNCAITTDVTISETHYANVGGVCGENAGKIEKTIANNNLNITKSHNCSHMGGISGYDNNDSYIYTCKSIGQLNSDNGYSGGISGISNGKIDFSYFIGTLSGYYIGGIAIGNNVNIDSCYSASTGGTYDMNSGIGCNSDSVVTNSYYDQTTSGATDTGYGLPKSTLAMKMKRTYINWDFDTIWGIDENINNGYPYLLCEYTPIEHQIIFDIETLTAELYAKNTGIYTIIFADYESNQFIKSDIQSLHLKQGYNTVSTNLVLGNSDKIFLWNNLEKLIPTCEAFTVE